MRILDLYCGAGGAAMGYHLAGFEVVGVDIEKQPNYPFEFIQSDALDPPVFWDDFAAVHASPPCQHYAGSTAWRGDRSKHPDLIAPTRELLEATDLPYVMENVPDARRHLRNPMMLCGSQFGLRLRRHRLFETNWPLPEHPQSCSHRPGDLAFVHKGERAYANAMGCTWMTSREGRQAIPPVYTEFIGTHLKQGIEKMTYARSFQHVTKDLEPSTAVFT